MTFQRILALCVAMLLAVSATAAIRLITHPLDRTGVTLAAAPPGRPAGSDPSTERVQTSVPPRLNLTSTTRHSGGSAVVVDAAEAGPPSAANPSPSTPQGVVLPTPTAGDLPAVAPLGQLRSVDALVLTTSAISRAQQSAVASLNGVAATVTVDTGTVDLAGAPAVTFGVDPATFRDFAPEASATATSLWQYIAGGALVSSYDMATDRQLPLGKEEPITSGAGGGPTAQGWLGAFASIGLPGVDLLVDRAYSAQLGLVPDSGMVVSAPNLSGAQLLDGLHAALPGASVELLRSSQVADLVSGDGLSADQRQAIMAAALSKVGSPYVWGGAGPSVFDCSGLVQWSFAQAGIGMPRTAAEQYLTGDHISLAQAQPGDLLFWAFDPSDPTFVDHTAIYLGNDLMVEAPHTGLDVQVVTVPTTDFVGAVQVLLRNG